MRATILTTIIALLFCGSALAQTTYYLGAFTGSTPLDDSDCGTGVGAHPSGHPCSTLVFWNTDRRSVLVSGDTVRVAAGTYGPVANANHCIVATVGVTYEGRAADDTAITDASQVLIDHIDTPNSGVCQAQMIGCNGCLFGGFILKNFTLQGGTNTNSCIWMNPTGASDGFELHYVRMTGCHGDVTDIVIGAVSCPPPGATCTRLTTNVVFDNIEVDNNLGHGLSLYTIDDITITNSTFHDNGNGFCGSPNTLSGCDDTNVCPAGNCNADDGIAVGGTINGTISDSEFFNNRQYGIDLSRTGNNGECDGSTHTWTVERNRSYDNGGGSFSSSGCANNLTFRNNFAWGTGTGFNNYRSSCNLKFYNNTAYMTGSQAFHASAFHPDLDVRNNIFSNSSSVSTISLSSSTTGTGNNTTWDYNTVTNRGSGAGLAIFTFSPDTSAADQADSDFACGALGTLRGNGESYASSSAGLTSWQAQDYFGATVSDNSAWGTNPLFVDATTPSVANLHLHADDEIAVDKGVTIASFSTDYDSETRPGGAAWDIGADEGNAAGTPAIVSALLGTTLSDGATETQIVSGGQTLTITMNNDTWVAAGATFDAQRQAIIDGLDSAQSETLGWNLEVRDKEVVGAVVRTSDTVVTITLTASGSYDITSSETITVLVPNTALVTATANVGSASFMVATVVAANTLSVTISGLVTDIFDSTNFLPGCPSACVVLLNNTVTVTFTYTTTATDRNSSAEFGEYHYTTAPNSLMLTASGHTWQTASVFSMDVEIRNGASADTLDIYARGLTFPAGVGASSENRSSSILRFSLRDDTSAVLSNDALPTSLTLADWTGGGIMEIVATTNSATGDYYRILVENVQTLN